MNLINEEDSRAIGVLDPIGCGRKDAAHVGHVGLDAAEPLEFAAGLACDDLGERSFSRAGRAVENEGLNPVGFNGAAKQLARSQDMALADKLAEAAGTHPR